MPLYLLKSRKFMNRVRALIVQLVKDVDNLELKECNPSINLQTLRAKFKSDITEYGKYCSRFITNETTRQIRTWKAQLTIVLHDEDLSWEDRSLAAYLLETKITDRLREEAEKNKAISEARYDVEDESLRTTSWTHSAKGYHPTESIREFKITTEENASVPRYESRPKQMAQMARDYHDSIQEKDQPEEYGRMMATEIVLEQCDGISVS